MLVNININIKVLFAVHLHLKLAKAMTCCTIEALGARESFKQVEVLSCFCSWTVRPLQNVLLQPTLPTLIT